MNEQKIDPIDLLKHQDTDAHKWAKAFCQMTGFGDQGWALGWFSNAMMCMHDRTFSGLDASLKIKDAEIVETRSDRDRYKRAYEALAESNYFYSDETNWMSMIGSRYNIGKIWVTAPDGMNLTTENGTRARLARARAAEILEDGE